MLQRNIVALQHRTNGMSSVQAKFLPVGLFAVFGIVFVGGMTKHGILHLLPHFHILFADIGQHLNRTLLHHFAHTGVELILLFLKDLILNIKALMVMSTALILFTVLLRELMSDLWHF